MILINYIFNFVLILTILFILGFTSYGYFPATTTAVQAMPGKVINPIWRGGGDEPDREGREE